MWRYDRIYVGPSAGGLEHLVSHLLPAVRALPSLDGWFFLRYIDEQGLHLRLRTRGVDPDAVDREMQPVLTVALEGLVGCPQPWYRPTIALQVPQIPAADRVQLITQRGYEREVARYGRQGIRAAERLFQLSSDVAVDTILAERRGQLSRKTLVPALMQLTATAFGIEDAAGFWRSYASHWLRVSRAPEDLWRPRFAGKAQSLRGAGISVLRIEDDADPATLLRDRWNAALTATADAYRADPDAPASGPLAMSFAHLMNNRLGVLPLEEAYYATLVACELMAVA